MEKMQISADIYDTTLQYLSNRIHVYEVFADTALKAEAKQKYLAMKDDCEDILDKFTSHYTRRKKKNTKKTKREEKITANE